MSPQTSVCASQHSCNYTSFPVAGCCCRSSRETAPSSGLHPQVIYSPTRTKGSICGQPASPPYSRPHGPMTKTRVRLNHRVNTTAPGRKPVRTPLRVLDIVVGLVEIHGLKCRLHTHYILHKAVECNTACGASTAVTEHRPSPMRSRGASRDPMGSQAPQVWILSMFLWDNMMMMMIMFSH